MNTVEVDGVKCRELTCQQCGAMFTKPLRRGKVPQFCDTCVRKKQQERLMAMVLKKQQELEQ